MAMFLIMAYVVGLIILCIVILMILFIIQEITGVKIIHDDKSCRRE